MTRTHRPTLTEVEARSTNPLFCPKCRARDAYTRHAIIDGRPRSWEARQALATWAATSHNAHTPTAPFTTEEA